MLLHNNSITVELNEISLFPFSFSIFYFISSFYFFFVTILISVIFHNSIESNNYYFLAQSFSCFLFHFTTEKFLLPASSAVKEKWTQIDAHYSIRIQFIDIENKWETFPLKIDTFWSNFTGGVFFYYYFYCLENFKMQ